MEQNEYKIPLFRGLIEQQLTAIVQPGSRWHKREPHGMEKGNQNAGCFLLFWWSQWKIGPRNLYLQLASGLNIYFTQSTKKSFFYSCQNYVKAWPDPDR